VKGSGGGKKRKRAWGKGLPAGSTLGKQNGAPALFKVKHGWANSANDTIRRQKIRARDDGNEKEEVTGVGDPWGGDKLARESFRWAAVFCKSRNASSGDNFRKGGGLRKCGVSTGQ